MKEVTHRTSGGGGSLVAPSHHRGVVRKGCNSAVVEVMDNSQCGLMHNGAHQLEIRVGNGAGWVVSAHQGLLDRRRERGPPNVQGVKRVLSGR